MPDLDEPGREEPGVGKADRRRLGVRRDASKVAVDVRGGVEGGEDAELEGPESSSIASGSNAGA